MRNSRVAAALLPMLLLAAACSAHSSGGKADADGPPSPSSVFAGKAPLSLAQLSRALVTDNDVPGWVVQMSQTDDGVATTAPEEFDPDDLGAQGDTDAQSVLVASPADCQPLADVTSTRPLIHRMASVGAAFARTSDSGTAPPTQINQMLIASHAPGDAQKVMDGIRSALASCASFDGRDSGGAVTPFTIRKGPAVEVGDASVSYVMTDTADKKTGAALVTVVRTGDTIASYISMHSKGGAGDVPLEIARKEDQKLRAALAARR